MRLWPAIRHLIGEGPATGRGRPGGRRGLAGQSGVTVAEEPEATACAGRDRLLQPAKQG